MSPRRRSTPPLPWTANRAARRRRESPDPSRPLVCGPAQGRTGAEVQRAGELLLAVVLWGLVATGAAAVIVSVLYVAMLVARRTA